jgi:hypothetical protein
MGKLSLKKDPKSGLLTLSSSAPDPQLSYDLNVFTLDFISSYIRNSLKSQAKEKRLFIEERIRSSKKNPRHRIGQLNSTFTVIGLSTGCIGFFLYLLFLTILFRFNYFKIPYKFFVIFMTVQLSYGFLIGYILWHTLLIASVFVVQRCDKPELT